MCPKHIVFWVVTIIFCTTTRALVKFPDVNLLAGKRSATDQHPFDEKRKFLDKILNTLGIFQILYGTPKTNTAKARGPVRVIRPPITNAVYYYPYSLASMCESSLETWTCPHCLLLGKHIQLLAVYTNTHFNTKWFVAVDQLRQEIVLVFRPTVNIGGMLVSASIVLKRLDLSSEIKIHTGFLNSVRADFGRLVTTLRIVTSWYPTFKVVITGLSLGGSQAAIATFLLKYRNALPATAIELYTYGQPRTGNKAFADYMNNLPIPVARVVNSDDLIIRIVSSAAQGYYHHHNELFLEDDGQGNFSARYCTTLYYEDPNCAPARGSNLVLTQPLVFLIEHLTYFGTDFSTCIQSSPVEFLLQYFYPLRTYFSNKLLEEIPKFSVQTTAVLDFRYLVTAGIRKLYKYAIYEYMYGDSRRKLD